MILAGYSILVIDDDEAVCEVIAMQLEHFGAKTKMSFNLADATTLIEKEEFHAVITDFRIPPFLGTDVLKIQTLRRRQTPVIILTGLSDFNEEEMLQLGASCVLDKPVSSSLLCEKLIQVIVRS